MRVLGKFINDFNFKDLKPVYQDITENADWNKCLDVNGMSLARCIYHCEDNGDCESDCVAQFKGRTANCPCEVCVFRTHTKSLIQFRKTVQVDAHVMTTSVKISLLQ